MVQGSVVHEIIGVVLHDVEGLRVLLAHVLGGAVRRGMGGEIIVAGGLLEIVSPSLAICLCL